MADRTQTEERSHSTLLRVHFRLLDEAKGISDRVMERLHALSNQYPTALPSDLVSQVERIRSDPAHERRRSPRHRDSTLPASVAEPADLVGWRSALVIDHSPGGLALLLDSPMKEGTVLLVWFGSDDTEDAWLPVEVKHCRPAGEKWIVGAELTSEAKQVSGGVR